MAGRSRITRTEYHAIVDAYREVGDNASQIARLTKRNRQTIAKALRHGWPELGFPAVHQPFRPATPRAQASVTGTIDSANSSATTIVGPDGLSRKQSAARTKEEDVILGAMQNLTGSAIVTTQILQKLIEQAPNILSRITGTGDDAITPREYVRLIRELSKVSRETSDSLNKLMAAGRLNTGEAGAITEHRHTAVVATVDLTDPEVQAERQRRIDHMIDIHLRKRAYVPGSYQGEEQGIVDVEVAEPVVD